MAATPCGHSALVLSVAATDWQPRDRLSRLCTIPINGVLNQARLPLQWRHRSFDLFCGLGSSNIGRMKRTLATSEGGISIARPLCSTASCHPTSRSRTEGKHDTDRGTTLPTDRIPTAAGGPDAAEGQV